MGGRAFIISPFDTPASMGCADMCGGGLFIGAYGLPN